MTDWSASGVPAPAQSLHFEIDASGRSVQDVLAEAVLHTYDISADSDALRKDPDTFERLRGDYPIRREFTSFTVDLHGGTTEMREKMLKLGFKLK